MISQVIDFLDFLDTFDSVIIEENNIGTDVNLQHIKSTNSGNNCIHTIFVCNNHRIVIQTYKEMNHNSIDVVQGKPELEDKFVDLIDFINETNWSDCQLNQLFVLYCGLWSKWVSAFYWGEMDSFLIDFGPDMTLCWADEHWLINVDDVRPEQLQRIIDFINAVEDICQ